MAAGLENLGIGAPTCEVCEARPAVGITEATDASDAAARCGRCAESTCGALYPWRLLDAEDGAGVTASVTVRLGELRDEEATRRRPDALDAATALGDAQHDIRSAFRRLAAFAEPLPDGSPLGRQLADVGGALTACHNRLRELESSNLAAAILSDGAALAR